jgi:hypothetical protein
MATAASVTEVEPFANSSLYSYLEESGCGLGAKSASDLVGRAGLEPTTPCASSNPCSHVIGL